MLKAKLLAGGGTATLYAEDVFSAYTYTGNGSTQTITNGIDLSGKGGMVWIKNRVDSATANHQLAHTARGNYQHLETNTTAGNNNQTSDGIAFSSSGFGFTTASSNQWNANTKTYVSWTFRNADKFYNHTTVVKTGGSNATVSFANLTTLGMVRVKRTDSTGSWYIWHRSLTAGKLLIGETTAAEATLGHITVSGTTVTLVNGVIADGTYLVEGFAHDTGPDGLIQCGSYVGNGSATGPTITLGFEPQFLLVKATAATADPSTNNWFMADVAREMSMTNTAFLLSNTSGPESTGNNLFNPTATGFKISSAAQGINNSGTTYIYLVVPRSNRPPTTGTQVYNAIARTGTGAAATVTGAGFAPDALITHNRNNGSSPTWTDRLRGSANALTSNATTAEQPSATTLYPTDEFTVMDGVKIATSGQVNGGTGTYINHFFKRAPGVFDVVCYTGTGAATTVSHGLGSVPELIITKGRSGVTQWWTYAAALGNNNALALQSTSAASGATDMWNTTSPTSSVFSLGNNSANTSTVTYVACLFATLAGISKVGSYTGNGSSQTIACGFTTGARFVMIKRTDSTGDWYVWDTVRGIVAGNDPRLSLNTTSAEVTTDDSIDPNVVGFDISQLAATNINVTSATYIFLALA